MVAIAAPTTAPSATGQLPLSAMRSGQTGAVRQIDLTGEDAKLLCAMGLCVGARLKLVRAGEPCVVAIGGVDSHRCKCGGRCRIGIAKSLASSIFIQPD